MPILTTSPSSGAKAPTVNPATGTVKNPAPGKATTAKNATGAAATYYAQPVFDPRIYSLVYPMQQSDATAATKGGAFNGGLTRGVMVWDTPVTPYKQRATMQFLFNPTTVTASYAIDAFDAATSLMYRSPADTAQAAFAMNQSISFSLFYDRTFELWGSYTAAGVPRTQTIGPTGKTSTTTKAIVPGGTTTTTGGDPMDPTVYGVNVDILAMKQLTGQFLTSLAPSGSGAAGAPANPNANPGLSQQGVMCMIPTWVYFGAQTGLVYYGFISGFNVTVTHWTQFMIPMRAVIDVSFSLLIPSAAQALGPGFANFSVLSQLIAGTSAANTTTGSTAGTAGR